MKIEIRSKNEVEISGYVNAVERRSEVLGQNKAFNAPGEFCEVIKSGTFSKSLKRNPNVELQFNHERVIGRTGTNLELREDNIGLHAKAVITDEQVVNAARSGKLTGWSFGMTGIKSDWDKSEDEKIYTRSITDLNLLEVSILTVKPAYSATSVEIRSEEDMEVRDNDDKADISTKTFDENKAKIAVRNREIEILKLKGRC